MRKLAMIVTAVLLVSAPLALAQDKPQSIAAKCGAEWKEMKAQHGKPAKGEGREAWQRFYAACRAKHSTVSEADRAKLTAAIEAYAKGGN